MTQARIHRSGSLTLRKLLSTQRFGRAVLALLLGLMVVATSGVVLAKEKLSPGDSIESFGLLPLVKSDKAGAVHTDDFLGKSANTPTKVLLLAFFASWCEPCKQEIPELKRLHQELQDKGLSVMLVNIDRDLEGREKAAEFIQKVAPGFPVLSDRFNLVTRRYFDDDVSLPALFVFDAAGSLREIHHGVNPDELAKLERIVREQLGLGAIPPEKKVEPKQTKKERRKKGRKNKNKAKKRKKNTAKKKKS